MRKFLIAGAAVASLLVAASAAQAGYWAPGPWGPVYVPTCGYVWNGFAYIYVCG